MLDFCLTNYEKSFRKFHYDLNMMCSFIYKGDTKGKIIQV